MLLADTPVPSPQKGRGQCPRSWASRRDASSLCPSSRPTGTCPTGPQGAALPVLPFPPAAKSSLASIQSTGCTHRPGTHIPGLSHLDVGIQGRMDAAGSQPDGQGSGVGEGGCHHVAGCREGEHLEAKFLVELDELRGGRLLPFTQNAAHRTAALLGGHLGRESRGVCVEQRKRSSDLGSVPAQAWQNHQLQETMQPQTPGWRALLSCWDPFMAPARGILCRTPHPFRHSSRSMPGPVLAVEGLQEARARGTVG